MRIAQVGTSMSLNQVVLNKMAHQREKGHDVTALCPDDEWARAIKAKGIRVIAVPFVRHSLLATPMAAVRMWAVCRHERFDVVHTHNSLPGMAGRIVARLAGVPAVVHTCRAWPLNEPRSPVFSWAYGALEILASRAAHAILFQNSDDMRSWSELKVVSPRKATLIGNGIDVAGFLARVSADARLRVRKEFGISNEAFVLVKVARLERLKGHDFLLQGLRRFVTRANREVVALFVGIGKDEEHIRAAVERMGLQRVVHFTGYRHDIPDILAAADVSVLTSLYEGVPRALMESMALGLPVVATDAPGTRMLVQSGRTGLLVEYGDVEGLASALMQVLENPELARGLGQAGKHRVETTFDERLVVDRILQVYDYVLAGGRGQLPQWNLEVETR